MKVDMRLFLPLFLLITSNALFAQDSATIKEINELVGPKFHFDTANNNFGDFCYFTDSINKNTIINAWEVEGDTLNYLTKIFILKRVNTKLTIIDSSATFGVDGMGPNLWVNNDTIFLDHSCHGCTNESIYKFDRKKQKYLLISLQYSEVIRMKEPRYNNVPIGVRKEYYNVSKQELTIKVWNDDETKIKSKRIIKKPLPKDFITDLAHYIDLVGEDLRNIYLQ